MMRRRDMLKFGLVLAAIPVGVSMVWEKMKTREDRICEEVHTKLSHYSDNKLVIEVIPFVDDVLDMTFSLQAEGPMNAEMVEFAKGWLALYSSQWLVSMGESALTCQESDNIIFTTHMVRVNYSHQVSACGLGMLLSVAVCAKLYQMRPEISLGL